MYLLALFQVGELDGAGAPRGVARLPPGEGPHGPSPEGRGAGRSPTSVLDTQERPRVS